MSSKNNIIDYILKKKNLKQADIAEKLGVSRAQVSKWKKGEEIPHNRVRALIEMAGLFGDDPEWCVLTKTPENAEAWIHYFHEYHNSYIEVNPCHLLLDDPDLYVPSILLLFDKVGIKIPEVAPNIFDNEEDDIEDENDFSTIVCTYLESYAALINWNTLNIGGLDDVKDDIFEKILEIEYYIREFALEYVDEDILAKFGADYSKVNKIVTEAKKNIFRIIRDIVYIRIQNNRPIMKNYFDLINVPPYDLDDEGTFDSILEKKSIGSSLPFFERTVLEHISLQTELLSELHLKLDFLLKPEDRKKLSKELKYTSPMGNAVLNGDKEEEEEKIELSERSLKMIAKSMKNFAKGKVSGPIDIKALNQIADELPE